MRTSRSFGAIFCLTLAAAAAPLAAQETAPAAPADSTPELVSGRTVTAVPVSTADAPRAQPQRRDRTRLFAEEIMASPQASRDMHDVVNALRPNWMRQRGRQSLSTPSVVQVYLDGVRLSGGPGELRNIEPERVKRVEYLDGSSATTQYGADHMRGAIMVFTR